jgi:hypothetical protein
MKTLTKVAVATILALGMLIAFATPASADVVTPADAPPAIVLALDVPQLLNLLLSVGFPVLVGLVTKTVTSSTWKAILLATVSLASGFVSALLAAVLAGVPFDVVSALLTGLAAWLIAIATHFGFWRPTGVTAAVQSLGSPPNS